MLRWFMFIISVAFSACCYSSESQVAALLETGFAKSSEQVLAQPLQYLLIIGSLSFLPAFVIAATSFTRIIVVLSMLRLALGLQSSPPNSVLLILALFLTLFTMQPVLRQVEELSLTPYLNNEISLIKAVETGAEQFRSFMIARVGQNELEVMQGISSNGSEVDRPSLLAITPAYMLTELKIAFQMGVLVFLPFVLIDLLVASTLMGLGMIMVPPMTIALPIKVIVFVLCDGWLLISQSLMLSIVATG